jgi:hypothetical protein
MVARSICPVRWLRMEKVADSREVAVRFRATVSPAWMTKSVR